MRPQYLLDNGLPSILVYSSHSCVSSAITYLAGMTCAILPGSIGVLTCSQVLPHSQQGLDADHGSVPALGALRYARRIRRTALPLHMRESNYLRSTTALHQNSQTGSASFFLNFVLALASEGHSPPVSVQWSHCFRSCMPCTIVKAAVVRQLSVVQIGQQHSRSVLGGSACRCRVQV